MGRYVSDVPLASEFVSFSGEKLEERLSPFIANEEAVTVMVSNTNTVGWPGYMACDDFHIYSIQGFNRAYLLKYDRFTLKKISEVYFSSFGYCIPCVTDDYVYTPTNTGVIQRRDKDTLAVLASSAALTGAISNIKLNNGKLYVNTISYLYVLDTVTLDVLASVAKTQNGNGLMFSNDGNYTFEIRGSTGISILKRDATTLVSQGFVASLYAGSEPPDCEMFEDESGKMFFIAKGSSGFVTEASVSYENGFSVSEAFHVLNFGAVRTHNYYYNNASSVSVSGDHFEMIPKTPYVLIPTYDSVGGGASLGIFNIKSPTTVDYAGLTRISLSNPQISNNACISPDGKDAYVMSGRGATPYAFFLTKVPIKWFVNFYS